MFQIVSGGALKILQNSFQIFKLSIKVILSFSLTLKKILVRLHNGYFGSYFWTT
jgi:hypothetical protein